jgi:hypothetical protein
MGSLWRDFFNQCQSRKNLDAMNTDVKGDAKTAKKYSHGDSDIILVIWGKTILWRLHKKKRFT